MKAYATSLALFIGSLFGIALIVLAIECSLFVHGLRRDADKITAAAVATLNDTGGQEAAISASVQSKLTDLDRVMLSIGGTAANVRKASEAWKAAADAQATSATQTTAGLAKTVADADHAVNDLDVAIQVTSHDTQPVLASMQSAADGLSRDVNDPAISDTFMNLDRTSNSFVEMSDIALGDEKLADQRFRQLMKPLSLTQRIIKSALGIGVPSLEAWFYGRADF